MGRSQPSQSNSTTLKQAKKTSSFWLQSNAVSEAGLTAAQINQFKMARGNWKDDSAGYEWQKTNLTKAKEAVFSSVNQKLARYLDQHKNLTNWIDSLNSAVNAEQTKATKQLAVEYQQILQSFNCSNLKTFTDRIWTWENFLLKGAC